MIRNKILNNLGQKSKTFRTNSTNSIFAKNKKNTQSISIKSKNSEIFKLNTNKTDYKNTNIILRQKSPIEPTKTNPNLFTNKTSKSNIVQKKQSYNIFNNYPNLNRLIKDNNILSYKKEDFFTNNSNYNERNYETELYQRSNILPLLTKRKNEFEISEEDKIFDQFLLKKKKQIKKAKHKTKSKIKSKKKKLYNSYEAPLYKVYKKIPQIINKIEHTKKLKNSFSLLKYQNLLFDVGSSILDWDSRAKLNNEFNHLRKITNKRYDLLRNTVRDLEKKEKEIIDNVNKQQDNLKKNLREKNYYCMTIGMNFHGMPNLKFHQTIAKLKYKPM